MDNLLKNFPSATKEDIIAFRNKIHEESIQKSLSGIGGGQMKIKSSNDNCITFENDMGTQIKIHFSN